MHSEPLLHFPLRLIEHISSSTLCVLVQLLEVSFAVAGVVDIAGVADVAGIADVVGVADDVTGNPGFPGVVSATIAAGK